MKNTFNIVNGVVAGLFSALLVVYFILEANLALDIAKKSDSFKNFTQNVQRDFPEQFPGKYFLIDMHGLWGRMVGRNESNAVVKGDDGMLFPQKAALADVRGAAKGVAEFSEFMKRMKIPFLYVQAPYKMDLDYNMLPRGGARHYSYQNVDRFITLLRNKVDVIDLRKDLCTTPDTVRKYFYRTDHHWNSKGGLLAARLIASSILKKTGSDGKSALDNLDESRWIEHTLSDWFLGSQGQRTGRFFAGMDDLMWHTPKFPTKMSVVEIEGGALYKGDFADVHIRRKYIDERQDIYKDSAYNVYTGGNYPLVRMRNYMALVKLKILLFGDSFTRPIAPFLSTVFSEIVLVDPRVLVKERVAELAVHEQPDCVVQLNNANVFPNRELFYYGLPYKKKWWEWGEFDFFEVSDFVVNANDVDSERAVFCPSLRNGHHYDFSADSVTGTGKEIDWIEVSLYHLKTKQIWKRNIFDVPYGNMTGGIKWRFSVPEVGVWGLRVNRLDGSGMPIKMHHVVVHDIRPIMKK